VLRTVLIDVVVFLSSRMKILGYYLKIGHDSFISHLTT